MGVFEPYMWSRLPKRLNVRHRVFDAILKFEFKCLESCYYELEMHIRKYNT